MVHGRRLGRPLTKNRKESLSQGTEQLGFQLPEEPRSLNTQSLFSRPYSRVSLEIGFGYGEHLLMKCQAHPEEGFIGCEPYLNGLSSFFQASLAHTVQNVCVYQGNGLDLLNALPDQSLEAIYLLFADPWPKKRHNKRRFIQPQTLLEFARVLKSSGRILIATDHEDYSLWIEKHINACPRVTWMNPEAPFTPPQEWTETRYQKKAKAEGRSAKFYELSVKNTS